MIGCWNAADTLPRAMESILGQTVADLELLVVDDGSTDSTPEVVRGYDDPRVRYLALEHQGISRSLNAGIAEARAPFVALQDADDWSLPERLERQLEALEHDDSVAVVGCQMVEVDETGRELTPRVPEAHGDVGRTLMWHNPVANTSAAFRKDVVVALGGYDAGYRFSMDYDLWLRVADRHRVLNLEERLAVRQLTTTNFGGSNERQQYYEGIKARVATFRRRRSLRGVAGLVKPALSIATPLPLKRALRRARGQAPS